MRERDIDVLAIQESHIKENAREVRKRYTWFFGGAPVKSLHDRYSTGVGLIVKNGMVNNIREVRPVNDRLMTMTIMQTVPLNIINGYAPHAERPDEEKDMFYESLAGEVERLRGKGVLVILGDFNARVQRSVGEEEECIGPFTFDRENTRLEQMGEEATDNRQRLLALCGEHDLMVANTWFQKPDRRLVTFRAPGVENREPRTRARGFETLDYILVQRRWRNAVLNVESDVEANVMTDHYPVISRIRVKLKKMNKTKRGVERFEMCNEEERKKANEAFCNEAGEKLTYDQLQGRVWDKARQEMPKVTMRGKNDTLTSMTARMIAERADMIRAGAGEEAIWDQTKAIRKNRKKEKKDYVRSTVSKQLDVRDRWLGIRRMRMEYTSTPYALKGEDGEYVPLDKKAETAANYLEAKHWGEIRDEEDFGQGARMVGPGVEYDTGRVTHKELREVIRKFKRRKAPGPDEVPMEMFK